jgi:hypothetical protein
MCDMIYVSVVDMLENVPSFACDSSEIMMMMDNANAMSEGDDDSDENMVESMDNAHDVNEDDNQNEQTSASNKKYYVYFKPNVSPISHRLRRRK